MNLHPRVLGLATAVALASACTSSDTTPAGTGPADGATAGDASAEIGPDAATVTANDSGRDTSLGDGGAKADASAFDSAAIPAPGMDGAADASSMGNDAALSSADGGGADAPAGNRADAGRLVCGPLADGGLVVADAATTPSTMTSFFVSSQTNATGNLGGLAAADARCQTLAAAVGLGAKTWHAYLSVEHDASNGNNPTNARDRIGAGPWYNSRGVLLAADLTSLHARTGDAAVFLDEHGAMIKGQWTGSLQPVEHDILTGSNANGTLALGKTCLDWTSSLPAAAGVPDGGELSLARVGHTDGLGPSCSTATSPNDLTSWNSAHDNAGCDNTAPRGGAGRIYCFAIN